MISIEKLNEKKISLEMGSLRAQLKWCSMIKRNNFRRLALLVRANRSISADELRKISLFLFFRRGFIFVCPKPDYKLKSFSLKIFQTFVLNEQAEHKFVENAYSNSEYEIMDF